MHSCEIFAACSWEKPGHSPLFGYDFWYQPRHKTMISSSWGALAAFRSGFDLQHVKDGLYGRHLHIYDWPDGELKQTLDLGETGLLPLEVHRLSDVKSAETCRPSGFTPIIFVSFRLSLFCFTCCHNSWLFIRCSIH
jgi:hypothetical protein